MQPPVVDDDYRRGYLCGLIRGDAHLGTYRYERPGRAPGTVHRFRLALADGEALDRGREYLARFGIGTTRFAFAAATGAHRAMTAIRTQTRGNHERVTELIAWPVLPSMSWIKGFLAGIFDAEGSCGGQALRIANTDEEMLRWITACLGRLGFDNVLERRRNSRLSVVRLRGGLPERMRFFLGTDPAITRKRTFDGMALKSDAPLRVTSIRPLGIVMRMYDITTGTGDFIANGVVSHNCFARPTHNYLGFDAGRDFEREIVVKVNAPEVLRAELARPSWKSEHVALGTNTDPYQWVEGRYALMRGIWEALRDAANPCSVLTKSPLLLRDLPLMLEIAQRTSITACLSIPTLDEKAWRATEPHTPSPRARLEAVAELNRAGIPTGVLVAPLMPGINDAPHQLEPLLEAGAGGGRDERRRRGSAPARGGAPGVHGVAARAAPGPRAALPRALPARRLRARERNGAGSRAWCAAAGRRADLRGQRARDRPRPAVRAPSWRRSRSRRCSEARRRGASALVALAGVHLARDLLARRAARDTVAASSGAMLANMAPARSDSGATSTSPRLRSIARDDRTGDVLGAARAHARRQLHAGVGEHAGVADEPGEDGRDADAAAAQLGAQRGREAAQAELRGVVERESRRRRPCPRARR